MTAWLDDFHTRRHAAMEPTIWVAIVVSALLHAAIFNKWLPQIRFPSPEELERRSISPPLVVNLNPPRISPPIPPPAPRVKPRPPIAAAPPPPAPPVIALERPAPKAPPPAPRVKPPPPKVAPPPVIALKRPAPKAPPPAPVTPPVAVPPSPPPVTAPTPAPRPAFDDLAAYIEAKRRARAASAPAAPPARPSKAPPEDEDARANRIVAENLGSQKNITFGYDPDRNGGVFNVELMSYDYAEFTFIGWNKEIRRITKQLIEVNKGDNSDIRIAVVRRMIAIIREQAPEDFLWESKRVGYLTLSARLKDNKALEDFLMQEFFGEAGLWR